ncbi:hypothetical protein CHU98_g1794 [Xylaria longipes]|nr:hypothetical protein CHU98_g1794 [Xylaria longipes]
MAQPGPRARALTRYFSNEHGFEAENYIAGVILYKRRTVQGGVERIVVKHARLGAWWQGDARDPEIDSEENLLRRLWGSEHTIRLLSVVDDRHHRAPVMWAPPLNRNLLNPPPILPWKLGVDPALYPNVTNVEFFVMEFLARGTGDPRLHRNGVSAKPQKSQPTRSRERVKVRQLDNIYGNLFTKGSQIIDFGLAHEDNTPAEAQRENMKFVGELARVVLDPIVEDRHRPRYMIRNIPGLNDFETYATAEFCRAGNLSYDFKLLVCMCLAVDEARRPTLRPVLEVCERNVGLTPNWMNLKDEVSELFDAVPLLNNGSDSGSEYAP